jgi:hypothetical protein
MAERELAGGKTGVGSERREPRLELLIDAFIIAEILS